MWASSSLSVTHESCQSVDHFAQLCFEGGKDFMQMMEMKWNKNATENWVNLCLAVVLCIKTLFRCVFIIIIIILLFIFCSAVCLLLFVFTGWILKYFVLCCVFLWAAPCHFYLMYQSKYWKKKTVGHIARLMEGQDPRCALRILSLCSFVRLSCICQLWHFFKRNTFLLKTITSNKCLVLI